MKSGTFNALYRHEFHMEFRRWLSRKGVWMYVGALVVLALAALTIWGGRGDFKPEYMLYATYAFPYLVFGISYRLVKREWSNGTYGWWLTLPFSRSKLMLAKYAASLAQAGLTLLVYFAAIVLLALYNAALHGTTAEGVRSFGAVAAQYLLVVAAIAPFMLSLGLLAGVLVRSRLKGISPLVWISFGVLGNALNWLNIARSADSNGDYEMSLFSSHSALAFWISFPVIWLLAALMLAGSVQICKKFMTL
ncbi:ABC transporter permease [Cohnella zeiphila]|uniref:ABC transporter permease n=1 Tax=Cohnella zeiphila TaxID=2761120 RepID=A0A7X0SKN0_9BACL|nr:ABC transporter permease [Cohnella zeiphila]MBB6731644.1 ABC transporter permease [Cohnella zeiphila]